MRSVSCLVFLLVAIFFLQCARASFNARQALVGSPKKVIYIDWVDLPADQAVMRAVDTGFNVVILAFWMNSGPTDYTTEWASLSDSAKQNAVNYAHSKNAVVMVSAGGSDETPYDSVDGNSYGLRAAQWAVSQYLDGVDFDMENFDQPLKTSQLSPSQTIQWLADATNSARTILGSNGVISHAPQAPYFGPIGPSNCWTGSTGGYSAVYQNSADSLDWYNIQFYNQGGTCYSTETGLFIKSTSDCNYLPGTSIQEISTYGVPLSKIVLGKYVKKSDASDGWVDPTTLGQWIQQMESQIGWSTGVMGWELHNNNATNWNWIHSIYP